MIPVLAMNRFPNIPRERWMKLVKELGYDPSRVGEDIQITDDHEHGQPKLHLSLVVPITREQVNELRFGER